MSNLEKEYLWGTLIIASILVLSVVIGKMLAALFSLQETSWALIFSLVGIGLFLALSVYKYIEIK